MTRLKKYLKRVYAENGRISYPTDFAGGKRLHIAPASIKIVSQGDTISEFKYRAVGFPYGNIDRVAAVEHGASGGYVYRASHQENVGLNLSLNIPGDADKRTNGRLSSYRHVNLTVLSFSSPSEISEV